MKLYITCNAKMQGTSTGQHWSDSYYPKVYHSVKQAERFCPEGGGVYTVTVDVPESCPKALIARNYSHLIEEEARKLGIKYYL